MATVTVGDDKPVDCTQVGNLSLRPLRVDDDNKLQFLEEPSFPLKHTTPLASAESTGDTLTGMAKVFDDNGVQICNTIERDHPKPWGKQHTSFHLFVKTEGIIVEIDWVQHNLRWGEFDAPDAYSPSSHWQDFHNFSLTPTPHNISGKLPDRDEDLLLKSHHSQHPFWFTDVRSINTATTPPAGGSVNHGPLHLAAEAWTRWDDGERVEDELADQLDADLFDFDRRVLLREEGDSVTFEARLIQSLFYQTEHKFASTPPSDPGPPGYQPYHRALSDEWQFIRKLTYSDANAVLAAAAAESAETGEEVPAEEFETWQVFGQNQSQTSRTFPPFENQSLAQQIIRNAEESGDFVPPGELDPQFTYHTGDSGRFFYEIDVVYRYSFG